MIAPSAFRIRAAQAAPRRLAFGLSGRLLLLTVGFVMLAEVLIFVPSAAAFRQTWMEERLEASRLAALAVEAAPDRMVNNRLAADLLATAEVEAVAVRRDGIRELVLNAAPTGAVAEFSVDLRELTRGQSIVQVFGAFFPEPEARMRLVGEARIEGAQFIEALVPQAPLAQELRAYSGRIFVASIVISLITATLIYVTLNVLLVRPIRRLTASITAFRDAPDRPAPANGAGARGDELGEAEIALADMQRGLSQTLRQKQRLAALGEAVTRVSHDLRNALSSASLISDRLAADEDARVRDLGARIFRSVDRAAQLCESTLRYGVAESEPRPRRLPLAAALDEAAAEAAPGAEAPAWDNRIDPDLAATCDPEHLHRIALNLFRNAAAAMAGRDGARLSAGARRRGGRLVIAIADTGPGVPQAVQARLFEPFTHGPRNGSENGKAGGAGLGLAIARDLARANGGDLRLARTGPDGSVFELDLPAG